MDLRLSHHHLQRQQCVPLCFVEPRALLDHHPLHRRVQFKLILSGEEQVKLGRVLLKTGKWSSCDSSDNSFCLKYVA